MQRANGLLFIARGMTLKCIRSQVIEKTEIIQLKSCSCDNLSSVALTGTHQIITPIFPVFPVESGWEIISVAKRDRRDNVEKREAEMTRVIN